MQSEWQEQISTIVYRCCVTVRLQHGTHVINESTNKANMFKSHTRNYNVFHCFVRDFQKQNNSHTYSI